MTDIDTAIKAVRAYAEMHPRPKHVTKSQAAEMLELSRPTVDKLIRSGVIKMNQCGLIHITEIDRAIDARQSAA